MNPLKTSLLSVFLLVASLLPAARADVIIGNLASPTTVPSNISSTKSAISYSSSKYNWKSVGFTMGNTSYDVTSLTLTLLLGSTTATPDITVAIYADNGSGEPSGDLSTSSALYTFSAPDFSGASTSSSANYTFTVPDGQTFALSADTTYWIVVSQTSSTGQTAGWANGSGSSIINSLSVATAESTAWYGNTTPNLTQNIRTSPTLPYFELDGTAAIPEPAACAAMLGVIAGWAVCARRFRRRG